MDEGDLKAEEPGARLHVDQLGAVVGELSKRTREVGDLVCNVVHAGAALREELADGRLRAERRYQLHAPIAKAKRHGLDALVVEGAPLLDGAAEEPFVSADGLVEVLDGHSDMVNPQGL